MNLLTSFARLRIAQHEAFLVVADGGADHLVGDRQKRLVETAHQRHRPFDKSGDFGQQAFVFHELEALREGKIFRVGQDDVGAPRRIEHDLGFFELGHVVVEVAHLERRRRHETVAAGFVACRQAVHAEAHDVRLFRLGPKGRNDGMQRTHP